VADNGFIPTRIHFDKENLTMAYADPPI